MRSVITRLRSMARVLCCCACCIAIGASPWPGVSSQAGGASAGEQPARDSYSLHGQVLDSLTGKPIARALVQGYGDRLAALTDRDGRFSFTLRFTDRGAQGGPMARPMMFGGGIFFGMTARKPGYVFRQRFTINAVPSGEQDQDLVLKLTPESVIEGRVAVSGDDHPESVPVSLLKRGAQDGYSRWMQVAGTQTNSRGEYRFAGLEAGEYKLATAEWTDGQWESSGEEKPELRYAPTFYPAGGAAPSGPEIHLAAGETLPVNLDLRPETFYPVRVHVTPPAESNGVQARVQPAGSASYPIPGLSLRYSPRDKQVRGVLPSGSYELYLQCNTPEGLATVTMPLVVRNAPVEIAAVTLLPSLSIPLIVHQDFTQADTSAGQGAGRSSMAARVLREELRSGNAIPASPVQVLLRSLEAAGPSVMVGQVRQPSDTPRLERVPPGTYDVIFYLQRPGYVASATSGGTDLLREPLVVSAGGGTAPIEITLRDDVGTVNGTIDAAGLEGANSGALQIAAIPMQISGNVFKQGLSNREGKFALGNMAPGTYRVFASHQPLAMMDYRSEDFLKRYGSKGVLVTVEPNSTASVTLNAVLDEEP